jgi:hypothetical protein
VAQADRHRVVFLPNSRMSSARHPAVARLEWRFTANADVDRRIRFSCRLQRWPALIGGD